jgi:hypothetical protein
MSSWSKRRKSLYALVAIVVLVGAVGVPAFRFFYKAPSCFDGVKNGDEQGIDCGGSCQKLCASAFIPVTVAWTRFEQVIPGEYNVGAYLINPNTDGGAKGVPYHFVLYDQSGVPVSDTKGTVTIPPHRNTLAFQAAVSTAESVPVRAFFEFTAPPDWIKENDTLAPLQIADKNLTTGVGTSLAVTLHNSAVVPLDHLDVYAVLYDKDGNTLDFSKTIVDRVPAQGDSIAPFTWPAVHSNVISIEVLPVAE